MAKDAGNPVDRGSLKRPYVKPVVESEQVFETLAMACGKCQSFVPIFQSGCSRRLKRS